MPQLHRPAQHQQPQTPSPLRAVWASHWFLICMFASILLAYLQPAIGRTGGPLLPEVTVKRIGISIIFFTSGMGIKVSQLVRAARNIRAHLLVATISMGLIPFFVYWAVVPAMSFAITALTSSSSVASASASASAAASTAAPSASLSAWLPSLAKGILVLACLPSPVGSSLILTKSCGGNEATAIFNSSVGSLLATFTTPTLVYIYLGTSGSVPFIKTLSSLGSSVLLPLVAGQIAKQILERTKPSVLRWPFGTVSQCVLLFTIYSTFCDAFSPSSGGSGPSLASIPLTALVPLAFTLIALHLSALFAVQIAGTHVFGVSRRDVIAAMFCAGQKSLTLGIPMVNVLFGAQPDVSLIVMPLLVYHPTQIVIDSLLVGPLRAWGRADAGSHKDSDPDRAAPANGHQAAAAVSTSRQDGKDADSLRRRVAAQAS
ncbi:putative sodium bile acid cotransporter [Entophlyctis helioformis]|nr:putative sodium bile acid cotransporter [Entophlyctis helioformis]